MKRRPACVVSADAYQRGPDVIVAMVTSQTGRRQAPGLGDVVVTDWQVTGLRAPSTVHTGRLLVLEQRLLDIALDRLTEATLADVDAALRAAVRGGLDLPTP
jgi:mRNA-degrading endonuclease toxin of MazEF toxin-antitoxin module